jgi:hypothetical protein
MLHPIFSTLVCRPELVAEHVSAYAELVGQEACELGEDWLHRVIAWAVATCSALAFLILAGVALMLFSISTFHWALLAVPGAALLLALLAFWRARVPLPGGRFAQCKAQLQSDLDALRDAGSTA